MRSGEELIQFFYWAAVTLSVGATWLWLMFSFFSFTEGDREEFRRLFYGGVLTVVFLSFVGWMIQTQTNVKLVPLVPPEKSND